MIFQHTYAQVLDGTKTQTRRLVGEGEEPNSWRQGGENDPTINEVIVRSKYDERYDLWKWRAKYVVGKTYAIQPGRGKKAVGRILVTTIRKQRLQDISDEDAGKETGIRVPPYGDNARFTFLHLWNEVHNGTKGALWEDNPEVWVLEFELVQEDNRDE